MDIVKIHVYGVITFSQSLPYLLNKFYFLNHDLSFASLIRTESLNDYDSDNSILKVYSNLTSVGRTALMMMFNTTKLFQ